MDRKPKPSKYRCNAMRRWAEVAVSDLWATVKKYLTRFALVALSAFLDPTFDFVSTGTPRTIQHRRLHTKG